MRREQSALFCALHARLGVHTNYNLFAIDRQVSGASESAPGSQFDRGQWLHHGRGGPRRA